MTNTKMFVHWFVSQEHDNNSHSLDKIKLGILDCLRDTADQVDVESMVMVSTWKQNNPVLVYYQNTYSPVPLVSPLFFFIP